ncbi:hypothetical protein K1T71_015142 [Dendrolimus kikuchii]|nr:hypothetical protein K1T71_015142 [Dendrolimus kikuchii]
MPKAIKSGVREMVIKMKSFFDAEKEHEAPIIPFVQVHQRIAAATANIFINKNPITIIKVLTL